MRCGWCQGSQTYQGKKCVCAEPKRPFFPKKAKKKNDDMLKSGHKHNTNKFLHETSNGMWFECDCGHTFKVTA